MNKLATALSLLVLGFASCKKAPPPAARPPRPVTVASAAAKDVHLYIDEIGRCVAVERVMIRPQVSGPITAIHFADGADVKKGDPLFSIDPKPFQAALDQANSGLTQEEAKAAFDAAQLQRSQKLSDRQVVSPQDLDSARSAKLASQAGLLTSRAQIEQAEINLDYCSINSPIDGRAGKRLVDAGNIVTANTTDLLEIQRQDPIYVEFIIPENQLSEVRRYIAKGTLEIVITLPDYPDKARRGKLDFLDSGVQSTSGTVLMRGVFDNQDRLFWPGQFVEVRILLDKLPGAVLVPFEAVQTGANGSFVFVANPDQTVSTREVTTGQRHGADIVIASGIKEGETVVVTGQLGLSNGAKISIVADKPVSGK